MRILASAFVFILHPGDLLSGDFLMLFLMFIFFIVLPVSVVGLLLYKLFKKER